MVARKGSAQFVLDARVVHGSKFEYLTEYKTAIEKIDIFCNKCFHTFDQTPNAHLGGAGCPKCAKANLLASRMVERDRCAKEFIDRAQAIHGDRYDYSDTEYGKNCDTRVEVGCRQHGPFKISPSNHLKGKGCPSCAKSGFDPKKPAYIYLLLANTPQYGEVIKVGISNVPKQRLAGNKKNDQIAWRMIRVARYPDGWLPIAFEKILIDFFGKPFKGKERFVFDHAAAIEAFDVVTSGLGVWRPNQ